MLDVNDLFPQLVKLTIFVFKVSLGRSALLVTCQCFLHLALHVLHKLSQLPVVFVLLLKAEG